MVRSLDGVTFAPTGDQAPGQVGTETRFSYHQDGDRVWAEYAGGDVVMGFLIGTRAQDTLDFRYVQLRRDGTTATGRCMSLLSETSDGRLRSDESWQWESEQGSGTSTVEELPQPGERPGRRTGAAGAGGDGATATG
ncbi:hypothetical protein [Streptomyces sp. ODS05-4]|uniref:hypothetical protein n=1 Tax=Streptomyces sp. ODS05-4 TaxID=2944939 RepID=UPI00210BC373|nr:hypothetical protein [Streptomyces sp. ODS05-4]